LIYEFPDATKDIRQGDIFVNLPRIDLSLDKLTIVEEDEKPVETSWETIVEENTPAVTALVGMRPVSAIVITQDCDAQWGNQITLCEIRPFVNVVGLTVPNGVTARWWVSRITERCKTNLKWFYLPPDQRIGFDDRMAVDFQVTISAPLEDLKKYRSYRTGRLIPDADEHFRERLSEFFRRYPYDEWYPLNPEELAAYRSEHPEAEPKQWQTPPEDVIEDTQ
jgi:hypothetical protein